ncbi:hypothetical protein K435DRAFT_866720 [Dendrothele bispora CBS 962.96]|uniref:F-box domain-containing protein n=1 Tax=Dendrothele bispora (strain CBS 962.96) TaxID=1314807 RepID=A0A4S8LGG0_DENBC|nr:hypothetical protein K435DRAFT_866720 [Dendrothele bispora CBS 962.96]
MVLPQFFSPRKQRPPVSTTDRYLPVNSHVITNPEILFCIFKYLDCRGLFSVSCTCRAWSFSASQLLYKGVVLNWEYRRVGLNVPRVRENVRQLKIYLQKERDASSPDWICDFLAALPSSTLQSLSIRDGGIDAENKFFSALIRSPALQSIRRLSIDGRYHPLMPGDHLFRLLSACPKLKRLYIRLQHTESEWKTIVPDAFIHNSIEFARIRSPRVTRELIILLKSLAPSLRELELNIDKVTTSDAYHILLPCLRKLRLDLRVLKIQILRCECPFVDDVIEHFPLLRELYCTGYSFSESMFRRVSDKLETLTLCNSFPNPIRESYLLDFLDDHSTPRPLKKLVLLRTPFRDYVSLQAACRERGVELQVESHWPRNITTFSDDKTMTPTVINDMAKSDHVNELRRRKDISHPRKINSI